MEIRLLDYANVEHFVTIPNDTDHIDIDIISGDMIMTYPIYYDTSNTREIDYFDGSITLKKKDFNRLNEIKSSYDIWNY